MKNQQIFTKNLKGKIPKVLVLQSLMFAFNSLAFFIKFLTMKGKSFSFTVEWKMTEEDLSVVVVTDWIRKRRKIKMNNMIHGSHQPYLLFFRNQKIYRKRKENTLNLFLTFELWCYSIIDDIHTLIAKESSQRI